MNLLRRTMHYGGSCISTVMNADNCDVQLQLRLYRPSASEIWWKQSFVPPHSTARCSFRHSYWNSTWRHVTFGRREKSPTSWSNRSLLIYSIRSAMYYDFCGHVNGLHGAENFKWAHQSSLIKWVLWNVFVHNLYLGYHNQNTKVLLSRIIHDDFTKRTAFSMHVCMSPEVWTVRISVQYVGLCVKWEQHLSIRTTQEHSEQTSKIKYKQIWILSKS